MFIKNPTELWDGIRMFILSGVLANFQLDNYFLPVKMIPLQSELTGAFILFIYFLPLSAHICCETGANFKRSNAICPLWDEFLQTFSTTLGIFLGPQHFEGCTLYNSKLCLFLVNILELLQDHIYHFLKCMPPLSFTPSHAWKHIQYSTAFLHNFVNI